MLPSENNNPSSEQPTGDLEHLFRQKFAEAEIAPRANLWEQIDHNLVVGQNETFRRRLVVYRWVAAASVLLLLGFGSWFGLRYNTLPGSQPELAARSAGAAGAAAPTAATEASAAEQLALGQSVPAGSLAAGSADFSADQARQSATEGSATEPGLTALANGGYESPATGRVTNDALNEGFANGAGSYGSTSSASVAMSGPGRSGAMAAGSPQYGAGAGELLPSGIGSARAAMLRNGSGSGSNFNSLAVVQTGGRSTAELSARMAALQGRSSYARPTLLPQTAVAANLTSAGKDQSSPQDAVSGRARRWRLLGSYAASSYNPNMDFSRPELNAPVASRTAVPYMTYTNSYGVAASEYRRQLRAGLSQRVALTAGYAANKHWTLLTGVELAEQRASSRTSYGFLDGKHSAVEMSMANVDPSVSMVRPPESHRTEYRYRSVAVPVSVQYGSAKPGVSVYAKVGAAVGLLLNSRSELEGTPEATKVYSLNSADSPYRRVQVAMRGGAGARYQPANATWSVALGPTAEAGLTTLNTAPTQTLVQRSRPYSVGMEASVEFGSKPAMVP